MGQEQICFQIDSDLKTWFQKWCIDNRVSMSRVMRVLIEMLLQRNTSIEKEVMYRLGRR